MIEDTIKKIKKDLEQKGHSSFLCLLFHRWRGWQDPFRKYESGYDRYAASGVHRITVQQRICDRCGKTQEQIISKEFLVGWTVKKEMNTFNSN